MQTDNLQEQPRSREAWQLETWRPPPELPRIVLTPRIHLCPFVGVPMRPGPYRDREQFKRAFEPAWYQMDPLNWPDMLPFTRDKWFHRILDHWEDYQDRVGLDYTPRFFEQLNRLLAKGGFVAVIGGPPCGKGDGKSIGGQEILYYLLQAGIKAKPHILFEHSQMQVVIDKEDDQWCILDIDEDLTATGSESGSLLIEIDNTWQTNRKRKLVILSIGVDPSRNPSAVDIHLIPAGINPDFQATRFGCFGEGRFLGWCVLQRKFTPEFEVKYGIHSEPGTLAEYKARATAYSQEVTRRGISGVPPEVEAEHIDMMIEWLKMEKEIAERDGREWSIPALDVIVTETKQLGLPTKTVNYPQRIAATAIYRFKKEAKLGLKKVTERIDLTELEEWRLFWELYQKTVFENYPADYPFADRDAWMVTLDKMGLTRPQIKEKLGIVIRVNSIGERIRRGVSEWNVLPNPTQVGTIGETFLGSRIESTATGQSASGRPDLSDTGETETATWAVNVKVSFETDFDRTFETSPEHLIARRATVFIFPTLGMASVQPIAGENTRYNSRQMTLCGIGEAIQRMATELGILTLIRSQQDERRSPAEGGGETKD